MAVVLLCSVAPHVPSAGQREGEDAVQCVFAGCKEKTGNAEQVCVPLKA